MGLFAGTVEDYRRHRSGIPTEVASLLVRETRSMAEQRTLLDLGTGTGFVVEALKRDFADVVGVDLDAAMLAAAEADVVAVPGQRIAWVQSRAEDYFPRSGWAPDLVTMARAFHWFDQDVVLAHLDGFVPALGTLAVMGEEGVWSSGQDWLVALRRLVQSFLGEPRGASDGATGEGVRSFREILERSAFSAMEEHAVTVVRRRDVASVIGYVHSTSFAAARLFGDRLAEFDAAACRLLADYMTDGVLIDRNRFRVLLARRP